MKTRLPLPRRLRTFVAFAMVGATFDVAAATKYVSPSGRDTNDGDTPTTAYQTIDQGLREIGPGGRLYVGGGTYEEAILNTIPPGRSATERTIVTNYENQVVIVRPKAGPPRVLEFNGNVAFITVAANAPSQIVLDGTDVSANVVKFSSAGAHGAGDWPAHIRLENLEIRHAPNSAVLGFSRACEFIRLDIHHAGTSVYDHGMYIEGTENVIDGCNIHDNYARGIQIFMSGKHADTQFASRNTVRNCRIHDNGRVQGTPKPGIDADSGTGNRIYNNLIYHNGQFGLMIQMGGAGNEVYNNTFFANGTTGIFIKASAGTGTVLRNNLAWENGSGPQFVDETGAATASHNLVDADPHFASTDPAQPDFLKLSATSRAAIDGGTSEGAVAPLITRDFWGVPRPQGARIDIGAAEYR